MALAVGNPSKVNGKLRVRKPMSKVSADEPSSLQGGGSSQNAARTTDNVATTPQKTSNSLPLQVGNPSVNAKGGLKGAISSRMYGKKMKMAR